MDSSDSGRPAGIVAALTAEAKSLGRTARPGSAPAGGESPVGHGALAVLADGSWVAVSGMGCEAAARSAQALAEAGCRALASWGLAGGLDPALAPGTLVVPERLLADGAPVLSATPEWRERVLRSLGARSTTGGTLLTSRRALVSATEKQDAFRRTGAVAVDMESYAVAQVAAARRLPFIAVRAIVDAANDEVPASLIAAADAHGRIATGRLILELLCAPRSVPRVLRLALRYGVARRSLRAASRAGAPSSRLTRSPA